MCTSNQIERDLPKLDDISPRVRSFFLKPAFRKAYTKKFLITAIAAVGQQDKKNRFYLIVPENSFIAFGQW
jgi:hypothetical protein